MRGLHRSKMTCDFFWRLGKDEWANPKNPHVKKAQTVHSCIKACGHSGLHKCKCGRKHGN